MSWGDNDLSSTGNRQWVAVSSVTGWPPTVVRETSSGWLTPNRGPAITGGGLAPGLAALRVPTLCLVYAVQWTVIEADTDMLHCVTGDRDHWGNMSCSTLNPVCPQQSPASWIIAQLQASTESCVTLPMGAAVVDCKGCKVIHRPLCLVQLAFVHLWVRM